MHISRGRNVKERDRYPCCMPHCCIPFKGFCCDLITNKTLDNAASCYQAGNINLGNGHEKLHRINRNYSGRDISSLHDANAISMYTGCSISSISRIFLTYHRFSRRRNFWEKSFLPRFFNIFLYEASR